VVVGALASAFTRYVAEDPQISSAVQGQVGTALESGISFVSTDEVQAAAAQAGVPAAQIDDLVANYADAQLWGLQVALLAAAAIALLSFLFTRGLPAQRAVAPAEPHPGGVRRVAQQGAEISESRAAATAERTHDD
jgi:hypothetical protein